MNILIPDTWLRKHLQTKATPLQIGEHLSLCGPTVERIHRDKNEFIYEIEVTTNRPDSMSVFGIAREASVILPRFNISAKLLDDPYKLDCQKIISRLAKKNSHKLIIKSDSVLNPRWTSIILEKITIKDSPVWLKTYLFQAGIRPINNIVDITNFLMQGLGQPAHAFDFDKIKTKNNSASLTLRAAKKGEKITTLDNKTHTLPGGDIVIEGGNGKLIDLCGIMGGINSSIDSSTKTVILFLQTYDPGQIRRTSMALAQRTQAATLFEKGIDSELTLPALLRGTELVDQLAGGIVCSQVYDLYPHPYKSYRAEVSKGKLFSYLGRDLPDQEIKGTLEPLGFKTTIDDNKVAVTVASFRRDVQIDVDIIEEVARIFGYQNIKPTLPKSPPPVTPAEKNLRSEEEIKIRLRDFGFTETYTYSLISEEQMDVFGLDKSRTYKLSNPLSSELVYLRPSLLPSALGCIRENLHVRGEFKLFELSMVYNYRPGNLPLEQPSLVVSWTGEHFLEAKGLAEELFKFFHIDFTFDKARQSSYFSPKICLSLGEYGTVGMIENNLLKKLDINQPVTVLEMDIGKLVGNARHREGFQAIPKYPPIVEDYTFTVPGEFSLGPFLTELKNAGKLVSEARLIDTFDNNYTVRIFYLDPEKTLTDIDIKPVREKILKLAEEKFGARIRS